MIQFYDLRQDDVGVDFAAVFLELCAQEVQKTAREWAARAAVEGQPQDKNQRLQGVAVVKVRVAHLPALCVVIRNDFTQFLEQGMLGQAGGHRFIMQAGVGARLETAGKRGECLNHIPIPERAVPRRSLRNAFQQVL